MDCLYCNEPIMRLLSIKEIFLFKRLNTLEMCGRCKGKFRSLNPVAACKGCGREEEEKYCSDCKRWQLLYPDYDFQHTALYKYNEGMKEWFESYKFMGNYQLRYCFAPQIKLFFQKKKFDLIIPIPLAEDRLAERGFNQVEGLLVAANVFYSPLLLKEKASLPQSHKNRKERLKTEQPFTLSAGAKEKIKAQHVLLVDDIYTTGRTLFHAAELILKCEPNRLDTFSFAR